MRIKRVVLLGGACALAIAVTLGYVIGRARAAGIPTTSPVMTYTGTLTDSAGTPLTGSRNMQLQIWSQASGGSTPVCVTPAGAQALVGGGFQIALPDTCTTSVHSSGELWTEILLDGASLGRTKIGAVPYAVEADTASNAAGQLNTRIAALESGAVTKIEVQYATSADAFHDQCVSNALYCGIMANRKCTALGYRAGWFLGETPDGFVSIAVLCVK